MVGICKCTYCISPRMAALLQQSLCTQGPATAAPTTADSSRQPTDAHSALLHLCQEGPSNPQVKLDSTGWLKHIAAAPCTSQAATLMLHFLLPQLSKGMAMHRMHIVL
jgi:hypothetical protein